MDIFRDRIDAGKKLARELQKYKNNENAIIIGLPRGGVPVAYEAAKNLNLPLDIVCPRKIGAPMNKEFAIGSITETGEGIYNEFAIAELLIPNDYINKEVKKEADIARHRMNIFRQDRPPRNVEGKDVILIDDGLATGNTMKAAIRTMRSEGAGSIIVAVPVAPEDTIAEISQIADEVICLSVPPFFQAVGQFYQDFSQTQDDEVIKLLKMKNE